METKLKFLYAYVYHCIKLIGDSYESKFTTRMYQKQHDVYKDSNLITIQRSARKLGISIFSSNF